MRSCLVAVLLCVVGLCLVSGTPARHLNKKLKALSTTWKDLPENFFDQKQDHFNPLNHATYKSLFYVNDEFFKPGGPVLLYFNGEAPLESGAITSGLLTEIAQQHNALVVSQETRFYGQSIPTKTMRESDMALLTTPQVLADAAWFQTWFQRTWVEGKYKAPAKTVWGIVGGSYSGALSAWYRQKYPHLVSFAYSSSGVVNPINNLVGFDEVIIADYSEVDGCLSQLELINQQLESMFKSKEGVAELVSLFETCQDESFVAANREAFFFAANSPTQISAQYGQHKELCTAVLKMGSSTPLQNFAHYVKTTRWQSPWDPQQNCSELEWAKHIQSDAVPQPWAPSYTNRAWFWQKCTEFGFFKTVENKSLFGDMSIDYYKKACAQVFPSLQWPAATDWIIDYYGGDKPQGEQIVFVNGGNDPWHPCSLQPRNDTTNAVRPALYTFEGSHCLDLMPPSPTDNESLKHNRVLVKEHVAKWLAMAQHSA